MTPEYDLAILGAGSGGLTAAGFAAQLGARVALVEAHRIGGDCTWTGCVPSKALLKAAKVAHQVREASRFGIAAAPPATDMAKVRDYVRGAIQQVYAYETPEELSKQGIDVILGTGRFLDAHTVAAGETTIRAKKFLLTTGAQPLVPPIAGLGEVPYLTYEQIFDNERLPPRLIVIGGGPIGCELAQAYQRLGSQVSLVARRLLPKDEPEASQCIERVFEREGIRRLTGRARSARLDGSEIVVATEEAEARGDVLLISSGRKPNLSGLDLDKAGVHASTAGIPVDDHLRTNVKHIYAAGDVLGGAQFTHYAGWQAFQAVRNALLPGGSSGVANVLPWVTFTDPEVAHVGLSEQQARAQHGDGVKVSQWEMSHADRALCEDDLDGFIKVVTAAGGTILGATVVAARAGEVIAEFVLALRHRLKVADLAGAIHAYPTYSTAVQQLAARMTIESQLSGLSGRIAQGLSKLVR
jgi:pyruvate/2-oxoglutarate dehydrogenase complex dihydrolipoamide dehydrogenase (E3) component